MRTSAYELQPLSAGRPVSDRPLSEDLLRDAIHTVFGDSSGARQSSGGSPPLFTLSTDIGLKRHENQDRAIALQVGRISAAARPFMCFAVSDGMGGMHAGAECATLALGAFVSTLVSLHNLDARRRLEAAAAAANNSVNEFARGRGGATLAAVLVEADGRAYYAHVGDSRIYAVSYPRSTVERLTIDDTMEEAFGGQGRDLVQYIGIGPPMLPHINEIPPDFDELYITSDGVHYLDQGLMSEIILQANDAKRAADRLVALSRWLGGPDNATIAAFRRGDVTKSLAGFDPFVRVWTPSESFQLLMASTPAQASGSMQAPHASLEPKAKSKRRGKSRPRVSPRELNLPSDQPDLLVTVTPDEADDAADS